jgi:hypothetical protein
MTISQLLGPREAAKALDSTPGTLAVWRCTRRYPLKFTRIGRKVFYRAEDIQAFIQAGVVEGDSPKPARVAKKRKARR